MDYEKRTLPHYVVAEHYDLEITPNFEGDFKYAAKVDIQLDIQKEGLTFIALHAIELELEAASIVEDKKEQCVPITSSKFDYDTKEGEVKITFDKPLPKGDVILSISFKGLHNDQMKGFYRSKYKDVEGNERIMVSTQFEANDARRCFPCIDEPAAKATFTATLIVPHELTALSNMDILRQTSSGTNKKVTFAKTPKMSTYLLAFCVGDFNFIESSVVTKAGTKLRIYTTPGNSHLGRFALDVGVKSLDIYDSMFGLPFPLPKMDMIAIPEFAAGAMENWGLVTYREVDLLLNEKTASGTQLQRVATVVAHELAHQWFGNLVTMKWWDDLWLNEGFASWMQNHVTHELYPEWKVWDQFITGNTARAMGLDSMKTSHPVQVKIPNAHDVDEVFDAISYCKGACVIQTVHSYIGHEDFIKGLKTYMTKHQYGNAETKDLCQAWSEASGKDVQALVQCWTGQMGFPVLDVKKDGNTLELLQSWFLADGSKEEEDKTWIIPMFTLTSGGVESLDHFQDKQGKITIKDGEGFVKLNAGQKVMVRVNYSPEMWQELTDQLKKDAGSVPEGDKAGLLLDCYALVKAGLTDPEILLNLISAFENEVSYIVWEALSGVLVAIHDLISDNVELTARFEKFASGLVVPAFQNVGWDNKASDQMLDKMLRSLLIGCLSRFASKDTEILAEAQKRFDVYVKDPMGSEADEALPADYRSSAFKLVLKQEDKEKSNAAYETLRKIYPDLKTIAEQKMILLTIGAVADMDKKEEVLDWTTKEIKIQDFFYAIYSVSSSGKEGLDLTWAYLKANYERIYKRISSANTSILEALIMYSAGGFGSEEKATEIEDFFGKIEDFRAPRAVSKIVESTRIKAKSSKIFLDSEKFVAFLDKI